MQALPEKFYERVRDFAGNYFIYFYYLSDALEYVDKQLLEQTKRYHRKIHVPIFAIDHYNSKGKMVKKFVVCSYERLWNIYSRMPIYQRHYYETIREGEPTFLFFDLEFEYKNNPEADGKKLHEAFKEEVILLLLELKIAPCREDIKVTVLTSDTPTKFSKHHKWEVKGKIFKNMYHCGAFSRRLFDRLIKKYGEIDVNPFMLWKDNQVDFTLIDQKRCFMDRGVYTLNRFFRIAGSSKKNKPQYILQLEDARGVTRIEDKELFFSTLVQRHDDSLELTECLETDNSEPVSLAVKTDKPAKIQKARKSTLLPVARGDVLYDAYVDMVRDRIRINSGEEACQISIKIIPAKFDPLKLIGATQCHYCLFKSQSQGKEKATVQHGEDHGTTGNHIYFVIDPITRTYYQKCHSVDCVGKKSVPYPFPQAVLDAILHDESKRDQVWIEDSHINDIMDLFDFIPEF